MVPAGRVVPVERKEMILAGEKIKSLREARGKDQQGVRLIW
jgi:hypothetical protein